jgi:MFS family permease
MPDHEDVGHPRRKSAELSKEHSPSRDSEQQADFSTGANQLYHGSGSISDPFLVGFAPDDPHNPMNFSAGRKWFYTFIVTMSVFAVTLTSAGYAGSADEIIAEFDISDEVYAIGISLYVLGFALGPCLWAPLSELYGRRILFILTHASAVAFIAGSAGCNSITSLLVFRFLTGTFGASPMTNSGGVIADLFPPSHRGLALSMFSAAPFLGPVLGPIMGGFVSITIGWRWMQGLMAINVGIVWIIGSLVLPETYGPVLLRREAERLSRATGNSYKSILENNSRSSTFLAVFSKALKRPWILLFREPIVLIASIYLAILYGTLYMLLAAFPIIYQRLRGWNEGVGGLAFLGIMVGMLVGLAYVCYDNVRYNKLGDTPPPEARLPPAIVGALALPIGMFAFAWTISPSIHWSVSIILSSIFAFGMVLVFVAILNYMIDAYTIYAASALAATAMLRSLVATAFPLFTVQMYDNLGINWASSIPAFLVLVCLPFPLLMYRYGAVVRLRCKYSKEAALLLAQMHKKE